MAGPIEYRTEKVCYIYVKSENDELRQQEAKKQWKRKLECDGETNGLTETKQWQHDEGASKVVLNVI